MNTLARLPRPTRPLGSLARRLLAGFAIGLALPAAFAQSDWPGARPISWVIPYPAGGSTDVMGRALVQRIAASIGATVVVENRAGATGTIGGAFVAKAAADGHTLLHTTIGAQSIAPHLLPSLPYDPVKDLEPVALVGTIPHVLVVGAAQPFKSVADLLGAAKAKPSELAFASGGNGTILQMQAELLGQRNGVRFTHVPYKGDTPALQDTLSQQVHFMFAPVTAALPHIKSGRLRALAATSATRLKVLPDVPTMAEAGLPGFEFTAWYLLLAPAKTPPAVVERLNAELRRIEALPDFQARLRDSGAEGMSLDPQQTAAFLDREFSKWAKVVKERNIKAE